MNRIKHNTKLHILHVTYDMEIGGTEQVIKQLAGGLDPAKFTSSVLCINNSIGPMGRDLQNTGIKHYILGRNPGLDGSLIKAIRKLIYDIDVDVLHCHQYTPYTYGVLASIFTQKRVIYTEHGRFYPDSYRWKRRLINPLLSLATESITAISEATKSALIHYEWFAERSIQVVYNGIKKKPTSLKTQEIRDKYGIKQHDTVLGTISRLDPIKNQIMMIDSFDQVLAKRPDCKLLIVGDGPERENLERHVESLNLQNNIVFTGFKDDPKPYLDVIDVFLLSSLSEGTSMTLLEAMSEAKPCVVTNVGGNIEILKHEDTGMIVESGNTDAFASTILTVLSDKTLYAKIARNAQDNFNGKFELQFMIDAYQRLYSD